MLKMSLVFTTLLLLSQYSFANTTKVVEKKGAGETSCIKDVNCNSNSLVSSFWYGNFLEDQNADLDGAVTNAKNNAIAACEQLMEKNKKVIYSFVVGEVEITSRKCFNKSVQILKNELSGYVRTSVQYICRAEAKVKCEITFE